MAVLNPYNDKEYILGVECDGPSYAKQLTVRDRDVLRASVLARGGWKMCRVWCAEWYHDREGAEARLLKLLDSIKPEKPVDEGVEEDEEEATRWFRKAGAQGHKDALGKLRGMKK